MFFLFLLSTITFSCNNGLGQDDDPIKVVIEETPGEEIPEEKEEEIETVNSPLFSKQEGTYNRDFSLEITTTTESALIYYTLDGTDPTTNSNLYSAAIELSGDGSELTIKAFAVKDGMENSSITAGIYKIDYDVADFPLFSLDQGTYHKDLDIIITSETKDTRIYYTLNGDEPTETSSLYDNPITVSGDTTTATIKAIAIKEGLKNSSVASVTYKIEYFTVTYNANGGSIVLQEKVAEGLTLLQPADPERNQYHFTGWYTDKMLTNSFNFTTDKISSDITLYAKWLSDSQISISVPVTEDRTITFISPLEVNSGENLELAVSEIYESYKWYLDGELLTPDTNNNQIISPGDTPVYGAKDPGTYWLTVVVKDTNGKEYSASTSIKIVN